MTPKSEQKSVKQALRETAAAIGELCVRLVKWITRDYPWCKQNPSGLHCYHKVGTKTVYSSSVYCRDVQKQYTYRQCCHCQAEKVKRIIRKREQSA